MAGDARTFGSAPTVVVPIRAEFRAIRVTWTFEVEDEFWCKKVMVGSRWRNLHVGMNIWVIDQIALGERCSWAFVERVRVVDKWCRDFLFPF